MMNDIKYKEKTYLKGMKFKSTTKMCSSKTFPYNNHNQNKNIQKISSQFTINNDNNDKQK